MLKEPIGVCVIVYNQKSQQILLGQRLNNYRAGTYGLPGGRIEAQEELLIAARRELEEETGLIADNVEPIGVIREFQGPANFIHFVFVCHSYRGKLENREPDKCAGWAWYSLANLPLNTLPGHRCAIDLWQNPTEWLRDIVTEDKVSEALSNESGSA